MGALADAKAAGVASADHVVLNDAGKPQRDGARIPGASLLFVVQGQDPADAMARRAVTDIARAVDRTAEESRQKLDAVHQQPAQALAQPQMQPGQESPTRGARTL